MTGRTSALRGRLAYALTLTLVIIAAGVVWESTQRATADPATPAVCPGVQLAPRLASDHGTPPTQTFDRRGRYVPIVMVHGWTSRATHDSSRSGAFSRLVDLSTDPAFKPAAERSLVGQIERIPGAAVFTFDYHDYAARWVTDDHLGPALGRAIDCLYAKSGEKVIVVAHSMGGLIARYALAQPTDGGPARAKRVSTVVTFGTPETGSLVALLADGALDAGAESGNRVLIVLRLILSYCGELTTQKVETGTLCDVLPAFLKAFRTDAGRALKTDSPQLRDLDPFPSDVTVLDALAGETRLTTDLGWFGEPLDAHRRRVGVDVGDVIVMSSSATHGAKLSKVGHCAYELNVVRSAADSIGLTLGLGRLDAQPLWKIAGPCFHTNLMRTIELTNEATGVISEDIGRRPSNSAPQVPLAPVAIADDVLPVCRDYATMSSAEKDVVLRRMQEAHGDSTSRTIVRLSVLVYCKLNPGRHIDGVYSPSSRSNPANGGSGAIPTCAQWRDMDDAASDAALLRVARERGKSPSQLATMRLVVGGYCAIYRNRRIDRVYGG